jgi:hypothetical protein
LCRFRSASRRSASSRRISSCRRAERGDVATVRGGGVFSVPVSASAQGPPCLNANSLTTLSLQPTHLILQKEARGGVCVWCCSDKSAWPCDYQHQVCVT